MMSLFNRRKRQELIERAKNGFSNEFKLQIPNKEIRFYLPIFDDHIQRKIIFTKDFYEAKELARASKYIPENAVILDIGSNIGNHLVYFSKILNAKEVYGFEPQERMYEILKRNLQINQCKAEVFNYALGNTIGKGDIKNFHKNNLGATSIEYNDSGVFDIKTLDSEFLDRLETIDFIKIDVEGFEIPVLEGGQKLLKKTKPTIWIEIFPDNFLNTHKTLLELGYTLVDYIGTENFIYKHTSKQ